MYVAGLPHRKRHQQPAEGGDAQQIVMPGAMWQFWRARGTFEGGNQLPQECMSRRRITTSIASMTSLNSTGFSVWPFLQFWLCSIAKANKIWTCMGFVSYGQNRVSSCSFRLLVPIIRELGV